MQSRWIHTFWTRVWTFVSSLHFRVLLLEGGVNKNGSIVLFFLTYSCDYSLGLMFATSEKFTKKIILFCHTITPGKRKGRFSAFLDQTKFHFRIVWNHLWTIIELWIGSSQLMIFEVRIFLIESYRTISLVFRTVLLTVFLQGHQGPIMSKIFWEISPCGTEGKNGWKKALLVQEHKSSLRTELGIKGKRSFREVKLRISHAYEFFWLCRKRKKSAY